MIEFKSWYLRFDCSLFNSATHFSVATQQPLLQVNHFFRVCILKDISKRSCSQYFQFQALDLQLAVTSMEVPYTENGKERNITLGDVCYKPLAPLNDYCVIQSLFQYFQNNKTKLNRCISALGFPCKPGMKDFVKATFYDHILYCTR